MAYNAFVKNSSNRKFHFIWLIFPIIFHNFSNKIKWIYWLVSIKYVRSISKIMLEICFLIFLSLLLSRLSLFGSNCCEKFISHWNDDEPFECWGESQIYGLGLNQLMGVMCKITKNVEWIIKTHKFGRCRVIKTKEGKFSKPLSCKAIDGRYLTLTFSCFAFEWPSLILPWGSFTYLHI